MNASIKISGLDELENAMSVVIKKIERESTSTLQKKAEIVQRAIRDAAPLGPTGNLKRSIVSRIMPPSLKYPLIAIVVVDRRIAPHAYFVEFGHALILHDKYIKHVEGRPFFRPTAERIIPRLRIENEVARAIHW